MVELDQPLYLNDHYQYRTKDGYAQIDLNRVRAVKDDVHAEAEVRWLKPPDSGLLKHGNLNLLSDRTVSVWRAELERRIPEYDWGAFLTAVTKQAKDYFRRGSPPRPLRDAKVREDRWFLEPFVQHGGPTVLAAPGGSVKSMFALALGATVASGQWQILRASGNRLTDSAGKKIRSAPVLYLDWESDIESHKERLAAICRAREIDEPADLYYRREYAPLPQAAHELSLYAVELGVEFLVIDSKGAALGGSPEDAETTLRFFNSVREIGVPTLIVDHVTNEAADNRGGAKRPFGSVFTRNMARNVWMAEKMSENTDKGRVTVKFVRIKANDATTGPSTWIAWDVLIQTDDRGRYEKVLFDRRSDEPRPDFEDEEPSNDDGRILRLLMERGPMTNADLREALGKDVATRMAPLVHQGKVEQANGTAVPKLWRLAGREQGAFEEPADAPF